MGMLQFLLLYDIGKDYPPHTRISISCSTFFSCSCSCSSSFPCVFYSHNLALLIITPDSPLVVKKKKKKKKKESSFVLCPLQRSVRSHTLVHVVLCWCFHNPPNPDMECVIFNVFV